nr:hypothetical protein [Tanacetum cinerariifolium]GEZ57972.1 hypothetical protein [Tanacetum cinerariifolium]
MPLKDAEEVSTKSDFDDETTQKIEEEAKAEATRCEGKMRKEEPIDLLGHEVMNKYYNDKLLYDRYCDKMLNRRAKSRITLKVYREDDISEIILEFKASDLHLGEWREVVTTCPNKKCKGWTSLYKQIQERMNYLRTTEAELGIDLYRSFSEQDHLDRLNDMANKKRKHADDIHDFSRANKRLKSSVQYKDHLACTVLNEPVLASALQVLKRLRIISTSVYAVVHKLKKDYWKELQFSLVDNSKLNDVYLLNKS